MITKVTDRIYRGPRLQDPTILLNYGIQAILNLEDNGEKEYVDKEKMWAWENRLRFYHHPMSEIWRPTRWQLIRAVDIMQPPYVAPIYVHCKHGQDRTGYAIAAYRIRIERWTFERAYKEAKDMGHAWWFAPYLLLWPKSLKEL